MSDFQQTITSLDLLHTSLYRMELFMNAKAVKNAKTDVISLISRLEKAERERDELRDRLSLVREQRDTELNKNTQLEAEITRRDAAAGEPTGYVDQRVIDSEDGNGGMWVKRQSRQENSYSVPIFTAAPPAVLPPKLSMDINPELQGEFRVHEATRRKGFNQALDAALALGAQQQKVVELPTGIKVDDVAYGGPGAFIMGRNSGFNECLTIVTSALDAANVKWEVKK